MQLSQRCGTVNARSRVSAIRAKRAQEGLEKGLHTKVSGNAITGFSSGESGEGAIRETVE